MQRLGQSFELPVRAETQLKTDLSHPVEITTVACSSGCADAGSILLDNSDLNGDSSGGACKTDADGDNSKDGSVLPSVWQQHHEDGEGRKQEDEIDRSMKMADISLVIRQSTKPSKRMDGIKDDCHGVLNFVLIDGTWSNSKAMASRLQVCSNLVVSGVVPALSPGEGEATRHCAVYWMNLCPPE